MQMAADSICPFQGMARRCAGAGPSFIGVGALPTMNGPASFARWGSVVSRRFRWQRRARSPPNVEAISPMGLTRSPRGKRDASCSGASPPLENARTTSSQQKKPPGGTRRIVINGAERLPRKRRRCARNPSTKFRPRTSWAFFNRFGNRSMRPRPGYEPDRGCA